MYIEIAKGAQIQETSHHHHHFWHAKCWVKKTPTKSEPFPHGELEETLSYTTWMKTIQQASNLSLNEAIDVAQKGPLWRLMSTFGGR